MRPRLVFALIAALLLPAGARANDSAAEVAAGGLVLRQNGDVDLVSEDLYVSRREIRVRYVFRNRAPRDVRLTVAFPMPDRAIEQDGDGDVSRPTGFRTLVDGRPVAMQVERRAMVGTTDHSETLRRLGIPIGHFDEEFVAAQAALVALPRAEQARLAGLGLIEASDTPGGERLVGPVWTVKETWYWEQVFPAGRDVVVEHSYQPGAGGTVVTSLGSETLRESDHERERIRRYCIDDSFLAAVRRQARGDGDYAHISEHWLTYILTTGGNWRSGIGDFRLVVDKGAPGNLVSFCGEGVRRISPTRFEMRRRNWRPTEELHVLFLVPYGSEGE